MRKLLILAAVVYGIWAFTAAINTQPNVPEVRSVNLTDPIIARSTPGPGSSWSDDVGSDNSEPVIDQLLGD